MTLDIKRTRDALQNFDFTRLFIEELGWNRPHNLKSTPFEAEGQSFRRREVAGLGGVAVFEIVAADGGMPDPKVRRAVHKEILAVALEHLLIFVDHQPLPDGTVGPTQSVWYWVKREGGKESIREHSFFRGQSGDLFLGKLEAMAFDFQAVAQNPTVTQVADRLKQALDVERVTRKFYNEFQNVHTQFLGFIEGIGDERDRRWYASVLLNRLMFIYFLQRKGFVDRGDLDYLQNKFAATKKIGPDRYYETFLKPLFFEGFAHPADRRTAATNALLGEIVYLNGGLFLTHPIEKRWPAISIADVAFQNLYDLFGRYSWNLDDTPGGHDDEINPDVLGYIFEKYINQKEFGAYYTRPEITEYLCRQTIHNLILQRVNEPTFPGAGLKGRHFDSVEEMLGRMDAGLCRELFFEILPGLSLLDPACGSGAFLVAALKTLVGIYSAIVGAIQVKYSTDMSLKKALDDLLEIHPSLNYYIKKRIITDNLFGVDVMEEATEIARLRLFLALVASASSVAELEPLPNIDFNILPGNSLVGLLHVAATQYQGRLDEKPYAELVEEKNRLIKLYRNTSFDAATDPAAQTTGDYTGGLQNIRDEIDALRDEASRNLNNILHDQFHHDLRIKYEQATWDTAKNAEGKPVKRDLRPTDIEAMQPFHWGFEFDRVMNDRGGFDAIITNPPWEIFKPQAKEFFQQHSALVTKNKMTIKEFETEQDKILRDPEIQTAWLDYLSGFPHLSQYFRSVKQYANQISVVNGKKAGTDINLYKLFVEQCYNLLRPNGQCGIVIPSGIYTDLGTKQLRELLFTRTTITGLFGFENRKEIFEGVHRSFKFVVLTFGKGGSTAEIKAAFMRLDVAELDRFPREGALPMPVQLIRRLSPDSLSIMEFKSDLDAHIAQKMLQFPLLGEKIPGKWNLSLTREFDMTNDSHLFKTTPAPGRLPMYEGKMTHQFSNILAQPRYWIDEAEGRKGVLGQTIDTGQKLDYQSYRMGFRRIGRNTDTRTMIATILPKNFFASESFNLSTGGTLTYSELLHLIAILNSFTLDYCLRQRVSANINMFYVYQLPVPRLSEGDPAFRPIVERAARLVCTTPEFKELWEAVMPGTAWDASLAATTPLDRAKLRAELDGLVAHLYGLTDTEFSHIMSTFPLVAEPVKVAAQNAYRDFAPNPDDEALATLIAAGESDRLEFKVAAAWNAKRNPPAKDDSMRNNIIEGVSAFLNSAEGGALVIGVDDKTRAIIGLTDDYNAVNPLNLMGVKSKTDRDRYEMWLHDILKNGLGASWASHYTIHFHQLNGLDICRISVRPADGPVYVNNGQDMYVRRGGRKEKLKAAEIVPYINKRWPTP